MPSPSIVWFRDDLRLADNPALRAAIDRDEPVIGLYVLDEETPGIRPLGGAARWWLHHSLASLGRAPGASAAAPWCCDADRPRGWSARRWRMPRPAPCSGTGATADPSGRSTPR